jgi:hypothetical protein
LRIRRPKLSTDVRSSSPTKDDAVDQISEEWEEILVETYDDLENPYRDSWWPNLLETLFPALLTSPKTSIKQKRT